MSYGQDQKEEYIKEKQIKYEPGTVINESKNRAIDAYFIGPNQEKIYNTAEYLVVPPIIASLFDDPMYEYHDAYFFAGVKFPLDHPWLLKTVGDLSPIVDGDAVFMDHTSGNCWFRLKGLHYYVDDYNPKKDTVQDFLKFIKTKKEDQQIYVGTVLVQRSPETPEDKERKQSRQKKRWWKTVGNGDGTSYDSHYTTSNMTYEIPKKELYEFLDYITKQGLHVEVCGVTDDKDKLEDTVNTPFWSRFMQSDASRQESMKEILGQGCWWDWNKGLETFQRKKIEKPQEDSKQTYLDIVKTKKQNPQVYVRIVLVQRSQETPEDTERKESRKKKRWWKTLDSCVHLSSDGYYITNYKIYELPKKELYEFLDYITKQGLHVEVCGVTEDKDNLEDTYSTCFWSRFTRSNVSRAKQMKDILRHGCWWSWDGDIETFQREKGKKEYMGDRVSNTAYYDPDY